MVVVCVVILDSRLEDDHRDTAFGELAVFVVAGVQASNCAQRMSSSVGVAGRAMTLWEVRLTRISAWGSV